MKFRFEPGERVRLLDKTCGPVQGLRNTLTSSFQQHEQLIPKFGIIESIKDRHDKYGPHYQLIPEHYDPKVFNYRVIMFYESDLAKIVNDWVDEDLFVI